MGTIYRVVDTFTGTTFTEKLQNAVNTCQDISESNCTSVVLIIPEGNYEVSQPIKVGYRMENGVKTNLRIVPFTIIGQPSMATYGTSIIHAPNGFMKIENTTCSASYITIENIAINGLDSNQNPSSGVAIECDGRWIKLKGLHIFGYSCGIKMAGAYNLIDCVKVDTCNTGIEITPVGVTIQNCHINGCSHHGIKTLPLNASTPSNALNIVGLIAEDNGTCGCGAQIEINETDYVSITNSYIGDNSTCAIKNNGGTHIHIDNMLQSIGGPHRAIHQTNGSMKCSGFYYCPDRYISGIKIDGGLVDFSDMKTYLAYSFIENNGGTIVMPDSRFQNGYNLSGTGDGNTKPTSFYGSLVSSGTNFMGTPMYELWSQYAGSSINTYTPGVCYNFLFPAHLSSKTIYLHLGFDYIVNDVSVDVFFNGGTIPDQLSDFLAESLNVVGTTHTRVRLKAEFKYYNIPITLSGNTLQVTIAAPLLQGQARNKVATIAFVLANEDNRFNIPLPWTQQ